MKKFLAVGFDFTGVLYGKPASDFSRGAADCLHVSIEEYHRSYFRRNSELNIQKIAPEFFWRHVAEEAGRPEHAQALLDYVFRLPSKHVNQDVVRVAQDLKRQGFKIGILSNNTPEGADEIRAQGTGSLFDAIVVSSEVGLMKPDPSIFLLFSERLGVDPKELIFIDDSEKSLSTAGQVGYRPILFTDTAALISELEKLGIHIG